MAFERNLVESLHLFLKLGAENLVRARANGVVNLIQTALTVSTSHATMLRHGPHRCHHDSERRSGLVLKTLADFLAWPRNPTPSRSRFRLGGVGANSFPNV